MRYLYLSFFGFLFFMISCQDTHTSAAVSDPQQADSLTADSTQTYINPTPQNGDIIFQESTSSQSKAIQLATNSRYSHMGIIYEKNGQFWVYEAIHPVQLTRFKKWVQRGKDQHYVIKRLKQADQLLTTDVLKKMKTFGQTFEGKPYDIYFGWSDERIYCSELVWKIYKEVVDIEIGALKTLADFDLSNPVVQRKMKERYGNAFPLAEKVISPADMFNSDLLITVIEK